MEQDKDNRTRIHNVRRIRTQVLIFQFIYVVSSSSVPFKLPSSFGVDIFSRMKMYWGRHAMLGTGTALWLQCVCK